MQNDTKIPVQDAAQHTPVNVPEEVAKSGIAAHQEVDIHKEAEELKKDVLQNNVTVPPSQFEPKLPQKKTFMSSVVDLLTFKWYKTKLRNRYGEDINRVREARVQEQVAHGAKPKKEPYRAPGSAPLTDPNMVQMPKVENAQPSTPAPSPATQSPPVEVTKPQGEVTS